MTHLTIPTICFIHMSEEIQSYEENDPELVQGIMYIQC